MATQYISVVNDILGEMNEVRLTETAFPSATNIQASVKEFVNRAYLDMNNPNNKWPWLSVAPPQDKFYGNTSVETVAGTRWYLLNPAASDINHDYGFVDWNNFHLTTEGVAGEVYPYTVRNLPYIELNEWRDHYAPHEEGQNSSSFQVPRRVIRSPDNRRFGLSGIPDKAYKIYFWAYNRPVLLVNALDVLVIPDQYVPVLKARTRYYAWQRKENPNQAAIAEAEYKDGLMNMRKQELQSAPDRVVDSRTRWI
jgi:hypothetical protein